jgi:hypothetical protein
LVEITDLTLYLLIIAVIMSGIGIGVSFIIPKKGVYIVGLLIIGFGLLLLMLLAMAYIDSTQQLVTIANVGLFMVIGLLLIIENRRKTIAILLGPTPTPTPSEIPLHDVATAPPQYSQQDVAYTPDYSPYMPSQQPQPYQPQTPEQQMGYPYPVQEEQAPKVLKPIKTASIICPKCDSHISVDPSSRGSVIQCPACGRSGKIS